MLRSIYENRDRRGVSTQLKIMVPLILALMGSVLTATGGTLTMQTNVAGPTPTIVGYNHGHYYPGSNTRDWWRYSGVTGDRVFFEPGYIEPHVANAPWGSGATNAATFATLKAAVRANPTNNSYFNWSYMLSQYATPGLNGSDIIEPTYLASEMEQMGIQTLVVSSASPGTFTNMASYGDQWELWLYYYEQAFYLGSQFNVQHYQMYNEPNDGGPSESDYLTRLQLASDAIQSAVEDVNAAYGKTLTALVHAPVTAGSATSSFSGYGGYVVTNRHVNYLGQTNASFNVLQNYDYHQYGSGGAPSSFGSGLATLEGELAAAMTPETPFPVTISEFNVFDGSQFESLNSTENTPTNYSAFAAIAQSLIANGITELYCFKLSETVGAGYPAKNGMLFVDNTNAPYNIGGITEGGEVWRLINKGFAPGRNLLEYQADSGASGLNVLASYDPVTARYYLLSVNNTSSSLSLAANFSAWKIPTNQQVLVEEVSQVCYGAGTIWTNAGTNLTVTGTQGADTVWLYTVPSQPQQVQTYLATDCVQVNDGANKGSNYSGATNVVVENNSTNTAYRSAGLIKFAIPAINPTNIQMAVLTLNATSANGSSNMEAFVYGITNNNWSQGAVTWSSAPNLAQGMPAGIAYTNNYVMGVGDLTGGIAAANSAQLMGQLVAGPGAGQKYVDVTSFVKSAAGTNISFLIARLVQFYGDAQNGDGISILSAAGNNTNGPQLQLVLNSQPNLFVISNVSVVARPNSAIITWMTSSNATGQVEYGTTPALGSFSALNTNLTTNQAVLLPGLTNDTTYYFEAISMEGTNVALASNSFSTDISLVLTSSNAAYSGIWTVDSAAPDKYSPYYEYSGTVAGADTADAVYRPNIVAAGNYDVYIWYSSDTNRSAAAPVTVGYNGGDAEVIVNEQTNGGSWQLVVADVPFAAGTNGFVRLGNGTGETNKVVISDAVEFVYSAGQDSATNGMVPGWWANFYFGTNTVNSSALGSNGYTLLADYVIGLSPVSAGSVVSMELANVSNGVQATFSPWEGGRNYGLQGATNLSNPVWTNVPNVSPYQSTNGQGVIAVTNVTGGKEYYRLTIGLEQ